MDTVSVIIPCYNSERWLSAAIESCLRQTYGDVEIVVVDDGSEDVSLAVARSYGDRVHVLTGPRRGVTSARNRGFEASGGEFIQFLDADDYLLPEKIERDVRFLQDEGADVVYGDWRIQHHHSSGLSTLGEVYITGPQTDLLSALLTHLRPLTHPFLHRREIVARVGGYDERLMYMEDIDFSVREVLSGADIRYHPGCYSIYRKYDATTHWLRGTEQEKRVCELDLIANVEATLADRGELSAPYRELLAQTYYRIARAYYDIDYVEYRRLASKALSLSPELRPQGSWHFNLLRSVFGIPAAERMSQYARLVRKMTIR